MSTHTHSEGVVEAGPAMTPIRRGGKRGHDIIAGRHDHFRAGEVGAGQPVIVGVSGCAPQDHDVTKVDLSRFLRGFPDLLVDRSDLEAAGGDGFDRGVVGAAAVRKGDEGGDAGVAGAGGA